MDYDNLLIKERLKFCKDCVNRKNDLQIGIVCGLTNKKPNFKNNCKDFKEDVERVKKERANEDYKLKQKYGSDAHHIKNGKSPFWINLSIAITVILLTIKVIRFIVRYNEDVSQEQQIERAYQKQYEELYKAAEERRYKVNTINYLSPKERIVEFNKKLEQDTVIVLNDKMKLKLPKGFYLSIANNETDLPIKATSKGGYYLIYNKVKKDNNKTLFKQWKDFRTNFTDRYPTSELVVEEQNTVKDAKKIESIYFKIENKVETIKGVAKIFEYKKERYFFQFVSKPKAAYQDRLNNYLNYYVKVKL